MKIMVISDTHEDLAAIAGVLDFLKTEKIDRIIHLGDYYDDADLIERQGYDLVKVPGTWDTCYYPSPEVSNRKFIEIGGWKLFLSHTPESHYNDRADDIKPETIIHRGDADIFLYGHTHRAEIKRKNGMVFINPGHMSSDENRGCPLTYALLEIGTDEMTASIMQLFNDQPYLRRKFRKSSLKAGR